MQRVAIARTLITNPSLLMMDEPLANLDTKLRGEMRRFIRNLQQRLGITTIFVTHDQIEAMELADRVAVIFDGELAQFDTPDVLYKQPASIEIADFMGATNVFPAQINGGSAVLKFGTLTLDNKPLDGSGSVMLRSEAIDLHLQALPQTENVLQGTIASRDFFGANITYGVTCGDHTVSVTEQSRRVIDVGSRVWLTIPPERIWAIKDAP